MLWSILQLPREKLKVNNVLNESNNIKYIPKRIDKIINNDKDDLFSNIIGKFRDVKVKLHIDKNVIQAAQPERRIPFALREKVQNEIRKLEVNDIIDDITKEPTPSLNPLVVVPKGESDARLCLDMHNANTAIERTRFPLPTADELMVKLRHATRFSKLGLNKALRQLELDPESHYITAF